MPQTDSALLDFVLHHARIKTNFCSLQHHEHGYVCETRYAQDYNLLYLTRGRIRWHVDQHTYELAPQSLLLISPGGKDHARSLTQRVTLLSIHVQASLPGGQDVFSLLTPPAVQTVPRDCRLDQLMRRAAEEFDRNDPALTQLMLQSWAKLITMAFLLHDFAAGLLTHQKLDPMVTQMLARLTGQFDQPVSLGELADWSGYTPQHLNRVFRQCLGVTPLQYLTAYRMERAAVMLRDPGLTIAAIGRRVGYEDAYYFSRVFKQQFGRSPSEFRGDQSDA